MPDPVGKTEKPSKPVARPAKPVEKKIAIIINGDSEARHLSNVERAVRILKRKGYKVYVASPQRPSGADVYVRPTRSAVIGMIKNIRSSKNSHIVYYNTGHGKEGKEVCLKDGCARDGVLTAIDGMAYKQRVMVYDSCFGGNLANKFTDDPRTLFISAGVRGKTTCCGKFAPRFWDDDKNIKDVNNDGMISWRERYEHAYKGHHKEARYFIRSEGYRYVDVTTGKKAKASFSQKLDPPITSLQLLKAKLGKLRLGQYAVVAFSASWCDACKTYKHQFADMARKAGGAYQFIWSESSEVLKHYGISKVPTVMIIDSFGRRYAVSDRNKLKGALLKLYPSAMQEMYSVVMKYSKDPKSISIKKVEKALDGLHQNSSELSYKQKLRLVQALGGMLYNLEIANRVKYLYGALVGSLKPDDAKREVEKFITYLRQLKKHPVYLREFLYTLKRAAHNLTCHKTILSAMKLLVEFGHIKNVTSFFELRDVAKVYVSLFAKLTASLRKGVIKSLRKQFGIPEKRNIVALYVFAYPCRELSPSDISYVVSHYKSIIMDGRYFRGFSECSVAGYARLAHHLKGKDLASAARLIREYAIRHGKRSAGFEYHKVAKHLSTLQAEAEARQLMRVIKNHGKYSAERLHAAAEMIGALYKKLGTFTFNECAETIRKAIAAEKNESKLQYLIEAYGKIAPRLSRGMALLGAYTLRNLFEHHSSWIRYEAIKTYEKLLDKLDETECLHVSIVLGFVIRKIKRYGNYSPHQDRIFNIFGRAIRKIKGQQQSDAIKVLRTLIVNSSKKAAWRAANAYAKIVSSLSPQVAVGEATWLLAKLKGFLKTSPHRLTTGIKVTAYALAKVIGRLGPDKQRYFVREYRMIMLNSKGKMRRELEFDYRWRIVRGLGHGAARQELAIWKPYLSSKRSSMRAFAARVIGSIVQKLPWSEVDKAIPILEPLLKDPSVAARVRAAISLMRLSMIHSKKQRLKVAAHVRMMFKAEKIGSDLTYDFVGAYEKMLIDMDLKELELSKEALLCLLRKKTDRSAMHVFGVIRSVYRRIGQRKRIKKAVDDYIKKLAI